MSALMRWILAMGLAIIATPAGAHGETAQMPQLRMSTVHWFDVEVSTSKLAVNDEITVQGRFMPSMYWPEHVESIEDTAFLNIGVPGPSFVRLDSRVNGVPMIRSTRFYKGETYDFMIRMKARKPGRYHVHPLINVKGTGPIIGPGCPTVRRPPAGCVCSGGGRPPRAARRPALNPAPPTPQ